MADNVKPTFPKSSVKSGLDSDAFGDKILDGPYPKKDVDQIDEANTVHDAPNSTSV